jgi:hypothetical protein
MHFAATIHAVMLVVEARDLRDEDLITEVPSAAWRKSIEGSV